MGDTMTISGTDLARDILEGKFDADLEVLSGAVRQRRDDVRKREGQLNRLTLKAGDRVTLKGLTPKLLNGAIVEVVEIRKTRVVVKSIEDVTDFVAAQRVGNYGTTVPLTCVTKVED